MENNIEQAEGAQTAGSDVSGESDVNSAGEGDGDSSNAPNANDSANTGGTEEGDGTVSNESGEEDIETVEDDEGKRYIPEAAFKARLAKLTAQKHQANETAISSLLESIKTNPEKIIGKVIKTRYRLEKKYVCFIAAKFLSP